MDAASYSVLKASITMNMGKRLNHLIKRAGALTLGTTLFLTSMMTAFAAETDIIDMNKTGSLTVHKYDITAANNAGVVTTNYKSNGEKDVETEAELANFAIEGVEFTYLKVSDIVTDSREGDVGVVYAVEEQLRTILSLGTDQARLVKDNAYYYTMQQLNDAIANLLADNTAAKNTLEDYIKNAGGTAMSLTDADGVTSAQGMPLGLYLVVETKVPENVMYTCDPFFVSVPSTDETGDYWFYDIDVYPKNQTSNPTLNKKVKSDETDAVYEDTATASGAETVSYIIVSKLPEITSKSSYITTYTFTDNLSKGIKYNRDAAIYFYTDVDAAWQNDISKAAAVWRLNDNNVKYSVEYTGNAAEGSTMVVAMTDAGLLELNPQRAGQYMVIAYTAQITSDANLVLGDNGNPNDVKLEWRRTSTNYMDTMEDQAIVYAYGLDIEKIFSNDNGDFSQVQLVLRNATDGHYLTAAGDAGLYYVDGKADSEDAATKFTPGEDGKLIIRELGADQYILTEIHTAKGFSLLKDEIVIDITCTEKTIIPSEAEITGTANYMDAASYYSAQGSKVRKFVEVIEDADAFAKVDDSDTAMNDDVDSANGLVDMHILNSAAPVLPKTGGAGLYAVTILGIVAFGLSMFISRKSGKDA